MYDNGTLGNKNSINVPFSLPRSPTLKTAERETTFRSKSFSIEWYGFTTLASKTISLTVR